jgi:hypothetical protein
VCLAHGAVRSFLVTKPQQAGGVVLLMMLGTVMVRASTQRGRVATGSGSSAADGDLAFKKGDAVGRGSRTACNESTCVEGSLSPTTIRIR